MSFSRCNLLIISLALLSLHINVNGDCEITQICQDSFIGPQCNTPPEPATDYPQFVHPFAWNNTYATDLVCPEFANQNVCCNAYQLFIQDSALNLSDQSFGSQNGGCDICAANLRKFWCTFTCSPNQSDFLVIGELENVTVPTTGAVVLARVLTLYVDEDMACALFQSCQKTNFITLLAQTQTSMGFLTFLGQNGAGTGLVWVLFNFTSNNATALNMQIHECSDQFPNGTDSEGYSIPSTNCTCNTCSQACQGEVGIEVGGITDGLDLTGVIATYASLVILVISCQFYRFIRRNKRTYQEGGVGTQSLHENSQFLR